MLRKKLMLISLLLVVAIAGTASAEDKVSLTPFGGLMLNGDSEFTVGTFIDYPLGDGLYIDGDVGVWFTGTSFYVNGGALYQFKLQNSPLAPYIAGGLGIWYSSIDVLGETYSSTDLKLNAGGGLKFTVGKNIRLRADFRFFFIEGSFERIVLGAEIDL